MREEIIEYQYHAVNGGTTPQNGAFERQKNHLIAILCTADPEFPLNLWTLLSYRRPGLPPQLVDAIILPQTELTLNLMRESRRNPKQSAWDGPYDFNAHPLAPIGTRIVINVRKTSATWVLGPERSRRVLNRSCA